MRIVRVAGSVGRFATRTMIRRIVSGGQTGADRAALDTARELGIETGGWVPLGRWAEDGRLPERYSNMLETNSADPAVRTEYNVRDSEGTVVFSHGEVFGGTKRTMQVSARLGRPVLRLDLATQSVDIHAVVCEVLRTALEPHAP